MIVSPYQIEQVPDAWTSFAESCVCPHQYDDVAGRNVTRWADLTVWGGISPKRAGWDVRCAPWVLAHFAGGCSWQ